MFILERTLEKCGACFCLGGRAVVQSEQYIVRHSENARVSGRPRDAHGSYVQVKSLAFLMDN